MRRTAVALAFLLTACEGLLVIEIPPDPGRDPRPDIYLDGGGAVPIPGEDGGACDVGDVRPAAVYYGTREPTMLSMSDGQKLSVVMYRIGGGLCSATVIADRWVLSAKHCNPSGGTLGEIHAGPDPDSPNTVIRVSRVIRHPGRDLLLLELSEPISGRLPSIVPIAYFSAPVDSSWRGRIVECAGYGSQEDGSIGERRFTAQPISGVDTTYVTVDGEGRRGLCGGDSGGPVLYQDTGGQIFVLGALTGGDSSCVGQDNYTRVDPTWIEDNVGPPPDPCVGLDARGRQSSYRSVILRPFLAGFAASCAQNDAGFLESSLILFRRNHCRFGSDRTKSPRIISIGASELWGAATATRRRGATPGCRAAKRAPTARRAGTAQTATAAARRIRDPARAPANPAGG